MKYYNQLLEFGHSCSVPWFIVITIAPPDYNQESKFNGTSFFQRCYNKLIHGLSGNFSHEKRHIGNRDKLEDIEFFSLNAQKA